MKIFSKIAQSRLFLAAMLIAVILCSCGSSSSAENEDRLSQAETAINDGDYDTAKKISDELVVDSLNLSADQLGRLSMIYMQLSDKIDDEEIIAGAIGCYRSAFNNNSDSAFQFYMNVSPEKAGYAQMLLQLVRSIDNPNRNDIPGEEEEDI